MLFAAAPVVAGEPGRGPGHGPPPEAAAACASLSASAACTFTVGERSLTGTCETPPGSTSLACRPSGPPPRHRGGPPAEAVKACASLTASAACSFTVGGDRSVAGTCETSPESATLACRPSGPPPGHRGPPQEAVNACSGLSVNATCAFAHGASNLTGACVALPGDASGSLACRPDRMPPPDGR
jgi:hypothetical protein